MGLFITLNIIMTNILTILSYNIWFDKTMCLERTISLCDHINTLKADVVCLQEVRPEIYEILIVLLGDLRYHFPKKINKEYGCVTFSRYPISKCLDSPYPNSNMGRSLLITKIDYPYHIINEDGNSVDKVEIVIANSHFESLFKKNTENDAKLKQYEISRNMLEMLYNTFKNVILCSDTNVMSHEEPKFDQQFEHNSWIDVWKIKGSNLNKFTYDSENNVYLKIKLSKFKFKSRIDRILCKTDNCFIEEFNIIKGNGSNIEPSDHFGIYGKFTIFKLDN